MRSHQHGFRTAAWPRSALPGDDNNTRAELPAEFRGFTLPGLADGNPINHPANIGAVYRGLAAVRGLETAALEAQVEANFRRLFGA